MDGEVFLLWNLQDNGEPLGSDGVYQDWWVLHGVFLTPSMANRRCDQMQAEHGGTWVVQKRDIGVIGEIEPC